MISPQTTWHAADLILYIGAMHLPATTSVGNGVVNDAKPPASAARLGDYLKLRPVVNTYADVFEVQRGPWISVQGALL